MASIAVGPKSLSVSLGLRERSILGRPNLAIELTRIKSFELAELPRSVDLGTRVSKRPFLGGLTGEWRSGPSRIVVLGGRAGAKALKISLLHPTIDEIWYSGSDIEQVASKLGSPQPE
ncbi:MAG: hypothetical protein EBR26_00630 [Microbacteriaceae bacterium]|nr:hypothetical protein [Microbacteriaceae bacterium]